MTHGPHLGEVCTHDPQWLLSNDRESCLVVAAHRHIQIGFGWTHGADLAGLGLFEVQQGGLWSSFAPSFFPGLIIGRKFSKLRQSTAFYLA